MMMMTTGLALVAALLVDVGEAKVISNSIYLAENQQKPGWRTTASGLQYNVVRSGPADGAVAGASSRVACTYTARLPHNASFLSDVWLFRLPQTPRQPPVRRDGLPRS